MALSGILSFAHAILLKQFSASPNGTTPYNAETKDYEVEKFANRDFQMPLHYPRYGKSDYEKMEEWKLDVLLREYGLNFRGSLDDKRKFAMGAFLWPDQF